MPGIPKLIRDQENSRDLDEPAPTAEDIKLWLPSDIPVALCTEVCKQNLFDGELRLQKGQCADALAKLRNKLLTKRFLISFRNANITGQRMSTQARGLIAMVGDGVKAAARKYRQAQAAVVSLAGVDNCGEFNVLNDDDMVLLEDIEKDAAATQKLGHLGKRRPQGVVGEGSGKKHISVSKKKMSWIWTAMGGPDMGSPECLQECGFLFLMFGCMKLIVILTLQAVRIEWTKVLARKCRWEEEVKILKAEMWCTLRSLQWEERQWHSRAETVMVFVTPEERAGH